MLSLIFIRFSSILGLNLNGDGANFYLFSALFWQSHQAQNQSMYWVIHGNNMDKTKLPSIRMSAK